MSSSYWLRCRGAVIAAASFSVLTSALIAAQEPRPTLTEWTVAKTPTLSIGGDGSRETEFLRIAGAFRLPNNWIAVVNGASNDIRLFDERGKFVRAFGRRGSGPGEFSSIGWVGTHHDTLFVADHSLQRISSILLDSVPRLVRSVRITAAGGRGMFFVTGRLHDGSWLAQTYDSPRLDVPPGVHRLAASAGVVAAAADGEVFWLADRPGLAVFVHSPTGDIKQAAVGPIAFSPYFYAAAQGRFVWFAESGSDVLERFDIATKARRSIRLPLPQVRPSRTLVAAARARDEARARDDRSRAWTEAKFSSKYLPTYLPRFEAFVPGQSGELWVQRYAGVHADPAEYLVIDAELRAVARMRVASGFRIHQAGADYVLGVHEDDDGVESVRMYRLQRR